MSDHEDELIVVPKGGSKTKFLMTFLLIVMLLTMFSVGDEVVAVLSGRGGRTSAYMTWTHPGVGVQTVSSADFVLEKRALTTVWSLLSGGQRGDRTDEDTARFIVFSAVADDAGVHVTDKELQDLITRIFGSSQRYEQILRSYQTSAKQFERSLRRLLSSQRYQSLMMAPFAIPKPDEVERKWKTRHQEYAFDYIELPVESVKSEAAAIAPASEDLKAWFDALPDAQRKQYETQRAASAELAVYQFSSETVPEALLQKFPMGADVTLDQAAQDYYDGFSYVRFRNPNFEFKVGSTPKPEDLFLPFEQVKEQAKREAPIYRAMIDWESDMAARAEKGETVDLAAEAKTYGLNYHKEDQPKTLDEWQKVDAPWMGRYIADSVIMNGQPAKFLPSVTVFDKGLAAGRVLEVVPQRMPEFAEIQDRVREDWIKKKAGELAAAKLEALRDKLGTRPAEGQPDAAAFAPEVDADTFKKVASEAGFEVHHRDFRERSVQLAPEAMTPAETYFRGATALYASKETSVPKAELAPKGENAYLVRIAGLRDADASKMAAEDEKKIREEIARADVAAFEQRTFQSTEYLKQQYGLQLQSWDKDAAKTAN